MSLLPPSCRRPHLSSARKPLVTKSAERSEWNGVSEWVTDGREVQDPRELPSSFVFPLGGAQAYPRRMYLTIELSFAHSFLQLPSARPPSRARPVPIRFINNRSAWIFSLLALLPSTVTTFSRLRTLQIQ